MRALITGATGFVGGRLAAALAATDLETRCLVRNRRRGEALSRAGHAVHEGDVLDAESLRGAGDGIDVAYYLIHSMGRGGADSDFAERERRAARNFARAGVRRGRRARRLPRGPRRRPGLEASAEPARDRRGARHRGPAADVLPRRDESGPAPAVSRTGRCATWSPGSR